MLFSLFFFCPRCLIYSFFPFTIPLLLRHSPKTPPLSTTNPSNLANSPMHPLPHRSLRLMPLPMLQPPRLVHFLDTIRSGAGLESGDIDGVGLHELFGDGDDVGDETVKEVEGHAFADDDAEDFRGVGGGGEGVVCLGGGLVWGGLLGGEEGRRG